MERIVASRLGDWTGHAEPGVSVEQIVADHQGGTTPALLVSNEVSLPGDIVGHLPDLASARGPPVQFVRSVPLGNTSSELTQIVPTPHPSTRGHDERAPVRGHLYLVPDRDTGVGQQIFAQPEPLTVPPLLDLGHHRSTFPAQDSRSIAVMIREARGPLRRGGCQWSARSEPGR